MQVLCRVTVRDENGSKVSRVETAVGEGRVPASWSLERRREALGAKLRRKVRVERAARMMGVLGSGHRLRILGTLAGGAATYRRLVKTTGLAAGPLYHHVNQLRLAGLVRPKERDLYEITSKGMRCLLMAAALGRMR
ncbi:MAG: winged helix-turn-helix transcriptional regulator [Phycisphaerales bacterium]|nr:MAG: winged helix-turn-helix transcriptional regulator [Phycisphaerales bacterium]